MRHMVKTESEDEIADALRQRIGYRKTQEDLANELGISRSYLSEILAGKKKVGHAVLTAMGYDPKPRYMKLATNE